MRKGRKLELLVKEIEALKLPNATITSPERVRDVDTNTLREVDIGIRYTSNEKAFFIALECRDRGSTQDMTWIEQLISKKNSVAADVLIAVTSSSFSSTAIIKAFAHGVVLRELTKFRANELRRWLDETYVEIHLIRRWIRSITLLPHEAKQPFSPLDQYTYTIAGISDHATLSELISFVANRDAFLQLRDRVKQPAASVDFELTVSPRAMYINAFPRVQIAKVNMQLTAQYIVRTAPIVSGFNYRDAESDSLLAEGFSYSFAESDSFTTLLIDSQTNKAKWNLDFSSLKGDGDMVSSIQIKCPRAVILTGCAISA